MGDDIEALLSDSRTTEQERERLKQLQEQLEQRKRRLRKRERRDETRRKVLIGAAVLARVRRGELGTNWLRSLLDEEITASRDREFLGLDEGGNQEVGAKTDTDGGESEGGEDAKGKGTTRSSSDS